MPRVTKKLEAALRGEKASNGGMDLPELRTTLKAHFPDHTTQINKMKRSELEAHYVNLVDGAKSSSPKPKSSSKRQRSSSSTKRQRSSSGSRKGTPTKNAKRNYYHYDPRNPPSYDKEKYHIKYYMKSKEDGGLGRFGSHKNADYYMLIPRVVASGSPKAKAKRSRSASRSSSGEQKRVQSASPAKKRKSRVKGNSVYKLSESEGLPIKGNYERYEGSSNTYYARKDHQYPRVPAGKRIVYLETAKDGGPGRITGIGNGPYFRVLDSLKGRKRSPKPKSPSGKSSPRKKSASKKIDLNELLG